MANQQELRQKWEEREFNYEEIEEWTNIGLTLSEYEFASWLRDEKSKEIKNFADPQWVKVNTDLGQLREEFANEESADEFRSPYEEEIENFGDYEEKINAQDWLNQNYPQERENTKEIYINEILEGELDLSDFTKLEKIYISYNVDEDKIEIKDKGKYEDKFIKLVNAQEYLEKYLEENYPRKSKSKITRVYIDSRNLEGDLKIEGFTDLEELYCSNNRLTNLKVIDCSELKTLYCHSNQLHDLVLGNLTQLGSLFCSNNYLNDISFLDNLNLENLTSLYIQNNRFEEHDLTVFSQFINLQTLNIGNDNKERIEKGNYNHFYGSLEPLKGLNKLTNFNISNTDIDFGLEYLPESVGTLTCEVISDESNFQVNELGKQLDFCNKSIKIWKEWNRRGFNSEEIKQWKDKGLKEDEYDFAVYLKKQKGYDNVSKLNEENIENLRKEDFNVWIKVAQNYLDNYSLEEMGKIVKLDISNKGLEGSLDLQGFDNLKELNLSNNQITKLKLENCTNLESLNCFGNSLKKTDFLLPNFEKLIHLDIKNNNFEEQELSFLGHLTNLEKIYLGNDNKEKVGEEKYNRFVGSLKNLRSLENLKEIDISNTDISDGLWSLPNSVKEIFCSSKERPESEVKMIAEQLGNDDSFLLSDSKDKYLRKITVQQAFDKKYLDASKVTLINLSELDFNVKSGLEIKGFSSLKKVFSSSSVYKLDKLSIDDCSQLEEIEISYSRDNKELKIDNCPNLTDLNCSNNQISELNLQEFSNLQRLDCSSNKLVNLEIPQDLQLEEINISKNDGLSKLNEELKEENYFVFYKSNGKYIKKQDAQEWLDKNFPKDESSNATGYKGKKRDEIKWLNVSEKGLVGELDLTGFTNLKEFNCSNNQLTVLNLKDCSNLERLNCYNNEITELNLNKGSKLKELQCYSNKFENLNISNLDKLEKLSCYDNFIKNLDFSSLNSKKITNLDVKNNDLSEQDISIFSKFTKLKQLTIGNDDKEKNDKKMYNRFFGSLNDLQKLTKLESLHISNTDINEVDIDYLPKSIREIYYSTEERPETELKNIKEQLNSYQKELDKCIAEENKKRLNAMYPNKSDKELYLWYREFKGHLDLSEYKNLEVLYCSSNQLTSLDISKNTKLRKLDCSNNKLKELNLENNVDLEELSCNGNELKILGIESCDELSSLDSINEEEKLKELLYSFQNTKDKADELAKKIIKTKEIQNKRTERNKLEGGWKKKDAQQWLDKEYPEDDKCLGDFDLENKGKKRSEIKELNISDENLIGELNLKKFNSLKHLVCCDNQLETIELNGCKELEIIDCGKNKLKEIKFGSDRLKLREFRGCDNEFTNLQKIIGCIDTDNLTHFDINNNKISEGKISLFANFKKLKKLFIGSSDEKKTNKFTDSLKTLKELKELLEIDVRNNGIEIGGFLEKLKGEKSWLKNLEKLYHVEEKKNEEGKKKKTLDESNEVNTNKSSEQEKEEKSLTLINEYYNKENNFYNIKELRTDNRISDYSGVKVILKTPLLSTYKKRKVSAINDNYERKKIDYYNEGKAIYPSEEETGFKWEIGDSLSTSELPIRLCHVDDNAFEYFSFRKYLEKDNIESISLENNGSLMIKYESGDKDKVKNIDKKPELQEIKSYLEKNNKKSLERKEINKAEIKIKKRVECADDAKYYAILSYSWGGKHKEEIPWSLEKAEERLSPGGIKSLDKAIKTLRVLNKFHLLGNNSIKHLWMDQLCVNQSNPKEKGHEVSKMRDYYGNSTVTLVAIHTEVGEKNIKKLLNSFKKGESRLIYPNEIVKSSLPILEKIISSEWFSRSWTYQEGFLSKRTIFMFDDFLIDGRFMALIWKLKQFSSTHYEECRWMKNLCGEKAATPVGWVYYEGGYSLGDKASLRLNEALWAVKDRGRALPIDGIYSIIGLLPYSDKVEVDYEKDPESVLREVMLTAVNYGHGEPLAWSGWGSRKLGLCWVPAIDENGSSSVTGGIKLDYDTKEGKLSFEPSKGIKIQASEYVISEKSNGLYEVEMREAMEGSLWRREVWVGIKEENEKLILSGTKEGIEAIDKDRVLIVPNRKEWKIDKPFAILALVIGKHEDNIRHRIDLVRIEEDYENLVTKEQKDGKEIEIPKIAKKTFIIGLDNQQYQAQVEINPYQK